MDEIGENEKAILSGSLRDALFSSSEESWAMFRYGGSDFLENVKKFGSVPASAAVVMAETTPYGLMKLAHNNAMRLSVEHIILCGEWNVLFEPEVIERACKTLDKFEHACPVCRQYRQK